MSQMIGPDIWKMGDRIRQSMYGKDKPDTHTRFEDRADYGFQWLYDPDWYEKVKPGDYVYVEALPWVRDLEAGTAGWSPETERLRLVQKKEAERSMIVSGKDDFWIEEACDQHFYFITNMRNGRKQVRYAIPKVFLRQAAQKFNLWLPD